jgi:hypothetical protein
LACLPYLPSLGGAFLDYDDPYLISANQVLPNASLAQVFDPTADRQDFGAEYLPVRDLTYWVDARLFGVADSAGWRVPPESAPGFRLTNLLWYAAACGLATALILRLPRPLRPPGPTALCAALLFAWHPAHAESVAWIAGRKDVVSGALALACLLVHLRAREGDRVGLYVASAILAGLACLAKSTATALPFLVLALEAADPAAGGWRRRLTRTVPTLVVCGAVALVAIGVGRATGIAQPWRSPALVGLVDLVVLRRYLVTALFPVYLQVDHGDLVQAVAPTGPGLEGLPWLQAGLAALVLAPLLALAWRRRQRPATAFVLVWVLGGLLPVLNLVPFVHWVADRFLFLPLLAPCLLLAWGLSRLRGPLGLTLAATALALLAGRSTARAIDFRSTTSLWSAQLRADPQNALALSHLGRAKLAQADGDPTRLADAIELLERALARYASLRAPNPGHELEARLHLGDAYREQGTWREAWRCYAGAADALGQPALRTYGPAVRRRLDLLAAQAATDGRAGTTGLEVAVRALIASARPNLAREALRRLAALDRPRAGALATELGLEAP